MDLQDFLNHLKAGFKQLSDRASLAEFSAKRGDGGNIGIAAGYASRLKEEVQFLFELCKQGGLAEYDSVISTLNEIGTQYAEQEGVVSCLAPFVEVGIVQLPVKA